MVHTCNSKHTQYRRMNATVALNNDAISSIRSRKYRKATSLLNRALLKSSYLEIGDSMQVQDDEMEEEETHECEYDEGLTRFPDPLMIPANRVNDPNFVKLVTFYNLGVSHLGSQNNEDALAYFDKALSQNIFLQSLSMNITNDDDNRSDDHTDSYSLCSKDSIALLHNLGHCYFRCQRFAESLEFYNRALELVLQTHGYYHLDVSSTLNCIGVVRLHSLTDKNDTTEILGVFTEALAIVQALLKKDQDQAFYATILNNIGRTRFAREEFQEAKAKYEESYQIRCRIYGQYHVDVAAVLYNAGEVEHLLGNFDEAISLYQKFIHISTSKFGEGHFDIAMAFKKIGQIYYERNETDKSIQMYVKALSAINQSSGENHIESATIMNKIGNICYECKDFDIALGIYEEGLKVERKILDYNHPNIVITLINIARIHHQQGTLDKALELHVEALEIQRSSCSNKSDRLNLACTLSSIGLINDQRKDYWSAIDAFEEALDIRTKELGENHFDVSSTLNAIGLIHFKQGLVDLALSTFKDSLSIRLKQDKPDTGDIAVILFNIGAIYLEIGETEKAINFYKQTLCHEYNASNKQKTDVVSTLQRLAQIYKVRGDLDEALGYYEEAVTYCRNNPDNKPMEQVAKLISCIGNIYLQKGDTSRAMEEYVKAMRINRLAGIDDNSNIVMDGHLVYDLMKDKRENAPAA